MESASGAFKTVDRIAHAFKHVKTGHLDEAGDRLFTLSRRLPSADTAAMLFWALLASGQI